MDLIVKTKSQTEKEREFIPSPSSQPSLASSSGSKHPSLISVAALCVYYLYLGQEVMKPRLFYRIG